MPFVFDGRVGNYRDLDSGRVVSRNKLLELVREDIARSRTRIANLSTQLNNNQISVGNWQRAMVSEIKSLHLRSALLASGGEQGLSNRVLGATGRRLRQEYDALKAFSFQIEKGELSPAQILSRSQSYTRQAITAFSTAELITRADNGAVTARRKLDPAAKHCPECPRYQTNGFVPLENVVPIGVACTCRGNCRCVISYRFDPNFNPLQSRSLSQQVAANSVNSSQQLN